MKYGLIGEHLSHSYSVIIHEKMGDYPYELLELSPDGLFKFMNKRSFSGINVTIPYKKVVMRYLDVISDEAQKIGAVNTVINKDGRLYGYNTDFFGLSEMLKYNGVSLTKRKVLVLGSGGTSKTAFAVCEYMGAESVILVSRTESEGAVSYENAYLLHHDAQVIINTTPVGMYPNTKDAPIDVSRFERLEAVCDCIYNPVNTELVSTARKRGVNAFTGLYMLVAQGALASSLFTGVPLSSEQIERIYKEVLLKKSNIVLIGMPSSGKSTVGKLISSELGLDFADSDDEIVKKTGMSIPTYFEKYGEDSFRNLESDVIRELALRSGTVIATGGGCVKRRENVRALKRNGTVVYIDRPLEKLIIGEGRPLSSSKDALERLFIERRDLYEGYADVHADGSGEPDDVAREIIKALTKKGN